MSTSSAPERPLRVGQLVGRLSSHVQSTDEFKDLWVEGEVIGAKPYRSGIVFFQLKETNAMIDGILPARHAAMTALVPRDGLNILVHGYVELNPNNGRCQLRIDEVRPAGAGEAYLRREALKKRLAAEGLFAAERKRPLPARPRRIGVVTSPSGAVWHDIQVVIARRDPSVELVLAPSQVQGAAAPDLLIAALDGLALLDDLDCVIVARGGGAAEDLSAFDDEGLARRIARMPVPVCVGVGHQTDFTIADLVADCRAATPSNAAELVVPDRSGALERARVQRRRIIARTAALVAGRSAAAAAARRLLDRRSPRARIDAFRQRLDVVWDAVERRGPRARTAALRARAASASEGLHRRRPEIRLAALRARATDRRRDLDRIAGRTVPSRRTRLVAARKLLESMSPLAVLGRGYAIVEGADGHVKASAAALSRDERARLRMRDGSVSITVGEVDAYV